MSFITNNANIFNSFYILCKRIEFFPLSMFIFFLSIKLSLNGVLSLVTVLFINIFSLCIFKNKTNSDWSHMLSIWNCINPCMYLTIKSNRPTLSFNEKKNLVNKKTTTNKQEIIKMFIIIMIHFLLYPVYEQSTHSYKTLYTNQNIKIYKKTMKFINKYIHYQHLSDLKYGQAMVIFLVR